MFSRIFETISSFLHTLFYFSCLRQQVALRSSLKTIPFFLVIGNTNNIGNYLFMLILACIWVHIIIVLAIILISFYIVIFIIALTDVDNLRMIHTFRWFFHPRLIKFVRLFSRWHVQRLSNLICCPWCFSCRTLLLGQSAENIRFLNSLGICSSWIFLHYSLCSLFNARIFRLAIIREVIYYLHSCAFGVSISWLIDQTFSSRRPTHNDIVHKIYCFDLNQ